MSKIINQTKINLHIRMETKCLIYSYYEKCFSYDLTLDIYLVYQY